MDARRKKKSRQPETEQAPKPDIPGFSADYRGGAGELLPAPSAPEPEIDDFLPEEELPLEDPLLREGGQASPAAPPPVAAPRRRRPRRYGIAVGTLVLLLALVGVGFLAVTVGTKIYETVTDDSRQRAYDSFLNPVVMQDPPPFESPDKADPMVVQNASLWRALLSDGGGNYTEMDDEGRVIVPLGDVLQACRELFGPECTLQPVSPQEESFYEFSTADNQYHVTLFSSESAFTAYTETIKKEGDGSLLRVGYVSPSDEWKTQTSSTVDRPTPIKVMEYVLKTDPDTKKEYIYAVRSAE